MSQIQIKSQPKAKCPDLGRGYQQACGPARAGHDGDSSRGGPRCENCITGHRCPLPHVIGQAKRIITKHESLLTGVDGDWAGDPQRGWVTRHEQHLQNRQRFWDLALDWSCRGNRSTVEARTTFQAYNELHFSGGQVVLC